MKTFDEIYDELKNGDNNELNQACIEARKESEKAKRIAGIICLIIDIFVVMMLFKHVLHASFMFLLLYICVFVLILNIVIFGIVTAVTAASKKNREFSEKYKNIVINKLMSNFYNKLEYFPNKEMPEYIYKELGYERYDRYRSDDYFEALINNKNSIQMAEVLTQEKEEYKDSDGNTKTRVITKFHGLFAKIELDKSINSELKIGQNGSFLFDKRLKMDSSEFEKYFDVQASNKIIGMQLLTADVMEQLIEFENKTKMKYDIFIKENELYLRFHSGIMFEAFNLKGGAMDKNTIQEYFYTLNFTYNLSNKLINVINNTEI